MHQTRAVFVHAPGNFDSYDGFSLAGLADVIIALMFIYLSGAVLIFGGEINQTYIAFKLRQR